MITLMLSKYGPLMVILVFGHSYDNNYDTLSAIQTVKTHLADPEADRTLLRTH